MVSSRRPDRDMLRLILAVLFRAGSVEVPQGGEKFTNYSDPRSRHPAGHSSGRAFTSVRRHLFFHVFWLGFFELRVCRLYPISTNRLSHRLLDAARQGFLACLEERVEVIRPQGFGVNGVGPQDGVPAVLGIPGGLLNYLQVGAQRVLRFATRLILASKQAESN
jgi:hypothetical protein